MAVHGSYAIKLCPDEQAGCLVNVSLLCRLGAIHKGRMQTFIGALKAAEPGFNRCGEIVSADDLRGWQQIAFV